MRPTPQKVTGGAHLRWIHRGLWEHAPAEPGGHLLGIDLVVLGLPAVDGLHREGMPQDKGHALLSPEVSEPVPGEDTLDRDHQAVTVGGNGLEEGVRSGLHVAVHEDCSLLAHNADVHTAGMPVDTTVKLMLFRVESHRVSSVVTLFSRCQHTPGVG